MDNRLSNIFDPIQRELDQSIFKGETPRPSVLAFIERKFYEKMKHPGKITDPQLYFELVLTGSLTTYQYSDTSDADISVIPDYEGLMWLLGLESSNEVRRHLVRVVTSNLDGTFIPGTQHPLQYFVIPAGDDLTERFKPGIRSGYHIQRKEWLTPPEPDRVHDVPTELPVLFSRASQMAEKMEILLDSESIDEAKELFAQIHTKRGLDQNEGLGDFSEGNIVYKYLLHEGLFDRLKEIGVHIAALDVPPPVSPVNFEFVPFTDAELAAWEEYDNKAPWSSKAQAFNQRARKMGLESRVNGQGLFCLWQRYQGHCAYDGKPDADTFDHIIPMWQGGENSVENLVPCHSNCNKALNKWDHKNQTAPYKINMSDKWYIDAEASAQWEEWELEEMDSASSTLFHVSSDPNLTLREGELYVSEDPDHWLSVWPDSTVYEVKLKPQAKININPAGEKYVDANDVADLVRLLPFTAAQHKTYKVIYDYERDRIILSENLPDDHVVEANHVILGGYDGENVNLGAESKQWLNANYFKRLWTHTFPGKTLKDIYIDDHRVQTRDKDFMTYLDKNPAVVNNPEVFKHVTADRWRKGKDWKDFIKNKGVIVEFKIGSDEVFDGRVKDVEKEYVKVEVAPGEIRKLHDDLLKSMKFRVRDDKRVVSAAPTANDLKLAEFVDEVGSDGCFGFIGGQLLIGHTHHQEIMAALFEKGWTWEDMFTQPQVWGWYELLLEYRDGDWWTGGNDYSASQSTVSLSFTSDAGKQIKGLIPKARQAFRVATGIYRVEDYFGGGVGKAEYGLGLSGDRATAEEKGYGAYVWGTVPPPPAKTPPAAV